MTETLERLSGVGPEATTAPCDAHRSHHPTPTYQELHHVVPQAWQAFWQPKGKTPLWDRRTVPLCPTGHRNVHFWLVRLMEAVDAPDVAAQHTAVATAIRRVRVDAKAGGMTIHTSEFSLSQLALYRWIDAGGQLAALTSAHLYGEA